jgi:hypothetical protein
LRPSTDLSTEKAASLVELSVHWRSTPLTGRAVAVRFVGAAGPVVARGSATALKFWKTAKTLSPTARA